MATNEKILTTEFSSKGIKFFLEKDRKDVARVFLYILNNGLHARPFALMEDLFVDENFRGQGLGTLLVNKVIEEARQKNCYKLICTSRHENEIAPKLYEKLGFRDRGIEFRMDF